MVQLYQANKRKKNRLAAWKQRGFLFTILFWPITLFIVFYVVVNANSIILAFQELQPDFTYKFVGFDNFKRVWENLIAPDNRLLRLAFVHSIEMFFILLITGMPLNILFGYLISHKYRGTALFRYVVLLPSIISGMITALMVQRLLYEMPNMMARLGEKLGIPLSFPDVFDADHAFGTMVVYSLWTGLASSSIIIYPNVMSSIDTEILESAKLDGCSGLREIWHITIPLIYPTITTFWVTGVAGMFVTAGPNFTFWGMNGPTEATNMGYYMQQRVLLDGDSQYGYSAALGLILTVITLPLTMLVKWIMEKKDPNNA